MIAREVLAPGTATHAAVVDTFGDVDRSTLADLVFSDDAARHALNAIVHPAVAAVVEQRLATAATRPVVLVVPLLIEAKWTDKVDHILVVDTPEHTAIERVVRSGRLTAADVRRRIAAQATRTTRLAHADTVITNDGSLGELARQVDAFWHDVVVTPPS